MDWFFLIWLVSVVIAFAGGHVCGFYEARGAKLFTEPGLHRPSRFLCAKCGRWLEPKDLYEACSVYERVEEDDELS